jgi:prepilin-type N-terminal cleavage/methylation domain-containing protein
MRAHLRSSRRRGFTILEILIAIVILVLGISGIIALFPTAIESGNQTVQDSYAAAITQSVVDAVSVGMRESRYHVFDGTNTWTYFIFDHDGVWDAMSPQPQLYGANGQQGFFAAPNGSSHQISEADWCILLPMGPPGNTLPQSEPVFNYPSVRPYDELGGGNAYVDNRAFSTLASLPTQGGANACDDWGTAFWRPNYKGEQQVYIRRVYHLGRYRRGQEPQGFTQPSYAPGPVRNEFLGESQAAGTLANDPSTRPVVDPYPQYSFSLSIRRAKVDAYDNANHPIPDGMIGQFDQYSNSLYEVRVMVFRNFDASSPLHKNLATNPQALIPRTNVPIREFVTLMSL